MEKSDIIKLLTKYQQLLNETLFNYELETLNISELADVLHKYPALQSLLSVLLARLEKAEKKNHRLSIITDVMKIITSSRDLNYVLEIIMRLSKQVLEAESSSLMLIDPETNELYFNVVTDGTKDKLKQVRLPLGRGIAGYVARTGEPLIINDVANDPRHYKDPDQISEYKTRNMICVPMKLNKKIIGVISVLNSLSRDGFTKDDMNIFLSFAEQAAIAINNKNLFTDVQLRLREISALYEITEVFNKSLDFNKNLYRTLVKINSIFNTDYCKVFLKEDNKFHLHSKAGIGSHKEFNSQEEAYLKKISKEPVVLIEQIYNKNNIPHTMIFIPMKKETIVKGVLLVVLHSTKSNIDNASLSILETIALSLTEAYENDILNRQLIEKQKLEKELEIAKDIQASLMPKSFKETDVFFVYGYNKPANMIGGDYYDWRELDDDHSGFIMADVSGKGVSAGIFMATVRSTFLAKAYEGKNILSTIKETNTLICEDAENGMFVTLFYALCDHKKKLLNYTSAGHNDQYLYKHKTKKIITLQTSGVPMGIFKADSITGFEARSIDFEKDDILLLYTDGATEALNKENKMFETNRLKNALRKNADKRPKEIIHNIIKEIEIFSRGTPQFDDISLLVVKFK